MNITHKLPLAVSGLIASAILVTSTTTMAGSAAMPNYKGEAPCPPILALRDGFYVGAQGGYDIYNVTKNGTSNFAPLNIPAVSLGISTRVAARGAVGGLFIGYGKYFESFFRTYLGLEIFANWSTAKSTSSLFASDSIPFDTGLGGYYLYNQGVIGNIKVHDNYGISVLPGIKLSDATLAYMRFGFNVSKIEVFSTVTRLAYIEDEVDVVTPYYNHSYFYRESNYADGFNFGVGMETAFYDHISARAEYNVTWYSNFNSCKCFGLGTPVNNQIMASLVYHI